LFRLKLEEKWALSSLKEIIGEEAKNRAAPSIDKKKKTRTLLLVFPKKKIKKEGE